MSPSSFLPYYKTHDPAILYNYMEGVSAVVRACELEPDAVEKVYKMNQEYAMLREITALRALRSVPFTVEIKKVIVGRARRRTAVPPSVRLVLDKWPLDLQRALDAAQKSGNAIPRQTVALIMFQLLSALESIHASGYAHRDIKPDNVLLTAGLTEMALCDFGQAMPVVFRPPWVKNSELVAAIGYRPPELAFDIDMSDAIRGPADPHCRLRDIRPVDIWGAGIIFESMLSNRDDWPWLSDGRKDGLWVVYTDLRRRQMHPNEYREFLGLGRDDEPALDLLIKMLDFNPNKRITAGAALEHRYFLDADVFGTRKDRLPAVVNWATKSEPSWAEVYACRHFSRKKWAALAQGMAVICSIFYETPHALSLALCLLKCHTCQHNKALSKEAAAAACMVAHDFCSTANVLTWGLCEFVFGGGDESGGFKNALTMSFTKCEAARWDIMIGSGFNMGFRTFATECDQEMVSYTDDIFMALLMYGDATGAISTDGRDDTKISVGWAGQVKRLLKLHNR